MTKNTAFPRHRRRRLTVVAALSGCALGALPLAAQAASAEPPSFTAGQLTPVQTDQLIVSYEGGAAARADAQAQVLSGATTSVDVGLSAVSDVATGGQVVQTSRNLSDAEVATLIADLKATDGVIGVEPNRMLTAQSNDPSYAQLWGLHSTNGVDAPDAWKTTRGAGAVVAVIDTGITSHPDLNANVLPGYDVVSYAPYARDNNGRDSNPQDQGDWQAAQECVPGEPRDVAKDSSWHGTHVAGTVAAVGDNSVGVIGVAPQAKVVPVRVLAKCGGSTSDIADAIIWSSGGTVSGVARNAHPADVINMSLGGEGACDYTTQRAIDIATANGSTVVVSAGNSNDNAAYYSPASCWNVITVAASDIRGNRAYYSNYGSAVEITAPGGETAVKGEGILSTLNSGRTTPSSSKYTEYEGTSMAAPHVSGVAALVAASNQSLTPAQIIQRLPSTATPLPGSCSGGCGSGLIDADAAIRG